MAALKTWQLIQLPYSVNAALASGRYNDITAAEVLTVSNHQRLLPTLEQRLGKDLDLREFSEADRLELNDSSARIANAVVLSDFRLDDASRGLALVMTFILEQITMPEGRR
jgi:hypothetical protein